jgi:diadenosine tetraphosphate (Ap4A) HIT family hydrolase
MVLVLRRHITSLAEMTDREAAELGPLILGVSRALHQVTSCAKTYVVQFAEAADHPHVHVHVIPRASDLPEELRGPSIFKLLGVPTQEWVPEDRMNDIAKSLKVALQGLTRG